MQGPQSKAPPSVAGELQSHVDTEIICHRDHRGLREPLAFCSLCSRCPLWLNFFWFFKFAIILPSVEILLPDRICTQKAFGMQATHVVNR